MTHPPQHPDPSPPPPARTVPLLLIGAAGGVALTLLAVALVTALIWPGWLIRDSAPDEDAAMSTATTLADGIQNRDPVTLHSVVCGDADPYVTDFTQRVLREHNLANVEGRPTVNGTEAEAKVSLETDGQTSTWTVELTPRNARTWCVAEVHL